MKKTFKILLSLFLVAIMAVSFVACGDDEGRPESFDDGKLSKGSNSKDAGDGKPAGGDLNSEEDDNKERIKFETGDEDAETKAFAYIKFEKKGKINEEDELKKLADGVESEVAKRLFKKAFKDEEECFELKLTQAEKDDEGVYCCKATFYTFDMESAVAELKKVLEKYEDTDAIAEKVKEHSDYEEVKDDEKKLDKLIREVTDAELAKEAAKILKKTDKKTEVETIDFYVTKGEEEWEAVEKYPSEETVNTTPPSGKTESPIGEKGSDK